MLAAIRLDEETDTIGDTLVLKLVDPKKGTGKSTSDPLASSTWEEVFCVLMAYQFLFLNEYSRICPFFANKSEYSVMLSTTQV